MNEEIVTNDAETLHPWILVLERLREASDDPKLQADEPKLADRAARLLKEAESSDTLNDEWFRTRVAYVISDIDRATEAKLALPPTLRSEIDRLAISSPDLQHDDLHYLLAQTAKLGHADIPLIQQIRNQARESIEGHHSWEKIAELEQRLTDRLTNPNPAISPTSSSAVPPQQAPAPTPADQRSSAPQQPPTAAGPSPEAAQPQQRTVGTPQQGAASALMNHMAGLQRTSTPPWQRAAQGLADRLATWQTVEFHQELGSPAKFVLPRPEDA